MEFYSIFFRFRACSGGDSQPSAAGFILRAGRAWRWPDFKSAQILSVAFLKATSPFRKRSRSGNDNTERVHA
jgi:hypothetical protein